MLILLYVLVLFFPLNIANAEETFQLEVQLKMPVESLENRLKTVYGSKFKQILFVPTQGSIISSLPTALVVNLGKDKITFPSSRFVSIEFDSDEKTVSGITVNPSLSYLDHNKAKELYKIIERDFENKNWNKHGVQLSEESYSRSTWKTHGCEAFVFFTKKDRSGISKDKDKDLYLVEVRMDFINESKEHNPNL